MNRKGIPLKATGMASKGQSISHSLHLAAARKVKVLLEPRRFQESPGPREVCRRRLLQQVWPAFQRARTTFPSTLPQAIPCELPWFGRLGSHVQRPSGSFHVEGVYVSNILIFLAKTHGLSRENLPIDRSNSILGQKCSLDPFSEDRNLKMLTGEAKGKGQVSTDLGQRPGIRLPDLGFGVSKAVGNFTWQSGLPQATDCQVPKLYPRTG